MKGFLHFFMRRRARRLYKRIASFLPKEGKVLDIGSGTGHNGTEILHHTDLELTEADVVDMNLSQRPPVIFDGKNLPFEHADFSTVLMIYILQYVEDPHALIREAKRVAQDKVVIMQTVSREGPGRWLLHFYEWACGRGPFFVVRFLGILKTATCPLWVEKQFSGKAVLQLIEETGGGLLKYESDGIFPRHEVFIIDAKEPHGTD